MPTVTSQADIIRDWEALLEAVARNPDVQGSLESERQALAALLREVQGLKARQEELIAQRQDVTQQLSATVKRGKEMAIQVRSVARGKIGPKSERLVHFKVAPIRRQPRKRQVVVKPPDEGTPGTDEPGIPAAKPAKPVA